MSTCIYCGSAEVVYDALTGYMVCSSCGSVLEAMYECEGEVIKRLGYGRDGGRASYRAGSPIPPAGRLYKIYRRVVGGRRLRKGVRVKDDALEDMARGARGGRIFTHVRDKVVEDLLEGSPILKKILDIMRDYPNIYSRTTRGRAAAAYIAAKIVSRDPIIYNRASKFFGLSRVHIKRIKEAVERSGELLLRVSVIEDLPREVARVERMISEYLEGEVRDAAQAI